MAHFDDPQTRKANQRYIRAAMDAPMLERGHELDLARRWKDSRDEKALHELVASYGRLVVSIAAKFRHYGLPMGDLIQEGHIGLMEAAARFEPDFENRFSTYASWWVKAQIQDYVLRNWSIVRTGTTAAQKSLFFNLRRLRAKLGSHASHLSTEDTRTIAAELGVDEKEVSAMESRLSGGDSSLNAPLSEDGPAEWQDLLADTTPTPEETVAALSDGATLSRWLNDALGGLDPRERRIVAGRQMADETVTLDDLGRQLGISKERVRQIEKRALAKLRDTLAARGREIPLLLSA